MVKRFFSDFRQMALACVVVDAAAFAWGVSAGFGMGLGIVGGGFSLVGTWGAIQLMSPPDPNVKTPGTPKVVWALLFLTKLPLFLACAALAQGLDGPGPPSFCLGIGLVYSLLIGWAQVRA